MKCDKCGSETIRRINGRNYVIECLGCGWSCVTTYTDPIYEDRTLYTISILPGNQTGKQVLRAVGNVAGVNLLHAKTIAEQGRENVFVALAPELRDKKVLLDRAGVAFSIAPEFPY